jgi:hypothetical protein
MTRVAYILIAVQPEELIYAALFAPGNIDCRREW